MYGTIRDNGGNGLSLQSTAAMTGGHDIRGNTGFGIWCSEEPDLPGLHGELGPNGSGEVSCPGVVGP